MSLNRSALPGSICGDSRPCSSRFIWQSRYGSGFGSHAEELSLLKMLAIGDRLALLRQVVESLDQKAAGAAGGVEHGLAEAAGR